MLENEILDSSRQAVWCVKSAHISRLPPCVIIISPQIFQYFDVTPVMPHYPGVTLAGIYEISFCKVNNVTVSGCQLMSLALLRKVVKLNSALRESELFYKVGSSPVLPSSRSQCERRSHIGRLSVQ